MLKGMRTFNFWEIFKCAFKIYSIWPQASKHARMLQTHFRNAVLLVWGLLRLTPITFENDLFAQLIDCHLLIKAMKMAVKVIVKLKPVFH